MHAKQHLNRTPKFFNPNSMMEGSKASRLTPSTYCLRHLERARSRGCGASSPQRRAAAFPKNADSGDRTGCGPPVLKNLRAHVVAGNLGEQAGIARPQHAFDAAAHPRRGEVRQLRPGVPAEREYDRSGLL